jgi:glycosyltransferase involved in cell wall biosynthesis
MRSIKKIALLAVGDDAWQGGIQYITNIINALNVTAVEHGVEVHLFCHSAQNFPELPKFNSIKVVAHNTEDEFEHFSLSNRMKWFAQRKWMGRINPRIENLMLKHGFDYVFPATLSNCGGQLNVGAWIADFQYHHFPDGASAEVTRNAAKVIGQITKQADKIILSSNYCEKDCFELFPISKGKTHVMPFAVFIDKTVFDYSAFEEVREKYSLPQQFIMVANLFAPTKNHKTLFNAVGILKKKGLTVPIVCTGNIVDYRNQAFANKILNMLTENKIRSQVHLLGLIPRADQVALYRISTALVQPSINEGWSTSVEEGKALGKKLILSDIAVHKEQYSDNPYFFSSLNAEDLADKIEILWKENAGIRFPQVDYELQAWERYQERVKAFGRRFLEIAA